MKKLQIAFVAAFFAALIIPIMFINNDANAVSATEKRTLASFPSVFGSDGTANLNFQKEFEAYLNDRIGLRSEFSVMNARVKLYALRMSPNNTVHVGIDGWYYYTLYSNLEIAKGTYPLTDSDLHTISTNQQLINNYYVNEGIKYSLLLTPSKASIYPEFIGQDQYAVRETPVDLIRDDLAKTEVPVISPKQTMLRNKDKGQLFRKTDTHWTTLGAYYAYTDIIGQMNRFGMRDKPIEVTINTQSYSNGDLAGLMGDVNLLPVEYAPDVSWQSRVLDVTSGSFYDEVSKIVNPDYESSYFAVFENRQAQYGTLLLYGDSQEMPHLKLPPLLAEHFQRVVYVGIIPEINLSLEAVVKPDYVIFACSERNINLWLTQSAQIPHTVDASAIDSIALSANKQNQGYYGMFIDNFGSTIGIADQTAPLPIDKSKSHTTIVGWAFDSISMKPLTALYLEVNGIYYKCEYGIERTGVGDYFGTKDVADSGFVVTIPTYEFIEADTIAFIQISSSGSERFNPVVYHLLQ
jgi:hypothetical protein